MLHLTLDELEKVVKVKTKEDIKPINKNMKRQENSVIRRFISLLILDPSLVEKSDKDIDWGESLDEQLAKVCISEILINENHNTASIFHALNNQFSSDFIDEIKSQVLNFDEQINTKEEIDNLRKRIKQNKFKK